MDKQVFFSESGTFFCDENSLALRFEPASANVLGPGQYRHLIVPEGIIGFGSHFGMDICVKERFSLPESLREIGHIGNGIKEELHNIFARSSLPGVIIPSGVECFGPFAFGASQIDSLCLPAGFMRREYVRQFKDARIRTIYVHEADLQLEGAYSRPFHWDCWYREVYSYERRDAGSFPEESRLTDAARWHGMDF